MKSLNYVFLFSVFYVGCADANPKEKISDLTCPYTLPAEKDFPANWVSTRSAGSGIYKLEQIDIAFGDALELKDELVSKERNFNTEITDDWTYIEDRAEYQFEYSQDHESISMMCTYGRTRKESSDVAQNVELLIPLPQNKPVTCLLIRRDVDPTYEMSCEIK